MCRSKQRFMSVPNSSADGPIRVRTPCDLPRRLPGGTNAVSTFSATISIPCRLLRSDAGTAASRGCSSPRGVAGLRRTRVAGNWMVELPAWLKTFRAADFRPGPPVGLHCGYCIGALHPERRFSCRVASYPLYAMQEHAALNDGLFSAPTGTYCPPKPLVRRASWRTHTRARRCLEGGGFSDNMIARTRQTRNAEVASTGAKVMRPQGNHAGDS